MSKALETEPVFLRRMCMEEYQPQTWAAIGPHFEATRSADELKLVHELRRSKRTIADLL